MSGQKQHSQKLILSPRICEYCDSSYLWTGFSGFQFQGVPGGDHTVTVESRNMNNLTTVVTTGTIGVRGDNAILI